MTPNAYQKQAKATAAYPVEEGVNYCIHGLTNEAGEVSGKYKKFLRGDKPWPIVQEELIDELGDVQWYVAQLADELGVTLEEVMQRNLDKLHARKNRGTIKGDGDKR